MKNVTCLLTSHCFRFICFFFFSLFFLFSSSTHSDETNEVILYGEDSIEFGRFVITTGGDVGTAGDLYFDLRSSVTGDIFSLGDMSFGAAVTIDGDVYVGGTYTEGTDLTVTGTVYEDATLVPTLEIPVYEVTPGTDAVTVAEATSDSLDAGSYGEVLLEPDSTLTLTGGEYHLQSLTVAPRAILEVDAATSLFIADEFIFLGGSEVILDASLTPLDFVVYTESTTTSSLRRRAVFQGIIYAPNGAVVVQGVTLSGAIFAKELSLLRRATITGTPPCLPEEETCDDGVDQDCDGSDLSCNDADLDGDGYSVNEGDTDDTDPLVNPGVVATEVCDGIDNDGDSLVDDDDDSLDTSTQSTFYLDADADTYGDSSTTQSACSQPTSYVSDSSDCDDTNSAINPAATETCDAVDNNCNGTADENLERCEEGVTLPADPEDVATETDTTVSTTVSESTEFLYTGDDAIQTGVAEDTIDTTQVGIIRGEVTTNDGTPLSGVTISIVDHSEYGSTLSRSDGMFDLAVNGGGYLTIQYEKSGYLTAYRKVEVPWQDFVWAEDVAMISLDSTVTTVDLSGSTTTMQVVQGTVSSDDDGDRTATVLVPPSVTATMTLSDDSTESLTTLNIRATEYTIGDNGPESMPASLPANSAFTYAIELSVDEALAVEATDVEFDSPLYYYVDNFLDFPVGTPVPAGYYDKEQNQWVASDDGIIIEILGDLDSDSLTELDFDGDGVQEDSTTLSTYNVTDEERENLSALYTSGQTLWRVPITHFSAWDFNWGFGPPDDAVTANISEIDRDLAGEVYDENATCTNGSIIQCENQLLGEVLPITGTPFSLHYQSDRVSGYAGANSLTIPVSGSSLPTSLQRIELEIEVAGTQTTESLAATVDQTYTFIWDSQNAYGQEMQGSQDVTIRVGYVYNGVYEGVDRFGYNGNGTEITATTRSEVILWQQWMDTIGGWNAQNLGLGGWSLSIHHVYDTESKILYLGDGTKRSSEESGLINKYIDESRVTSTLDNPYYVAVDHEGSIYISYNGLQIIKKIDIEGNVTTVAGTYARVGSSGDGGPATSAYLYSPRGIDVDSEGNLYIADSSNCMVRKVDTDGIITTIAGIARSCGFSGDGGPATSAELESLGDVVVDKDGNLYIATSERIRKVSTEGIITTIAGDGGLISGGDYGFEGLAVDGHIGSETGIDVDDEGNVYYASSGFVVKVTPDGIMDRIAGTYTWETDHGDGGPAIEADLSPIDVVIDNQGNIYVTELWYIRKIATDGTITTIAGNPDGTLPVEASNGKMATSINIRPYGIAVDADGIIYVADYYYDGVRKIFSPFISFSQNDIVIASEDGSEIYQFDETGRHETTLNALTGQTIYTFGYDSNNLLITITDGDNNITTINRNSDGTPTSIQGPFGQTTSLSLNTDGYLETITNPDSEAHTFTYYDGGLLETFTDPESNTKTYFYDSNGKLTAAQDALTHQKSFTRTENSNGFSVALTTAESVTQSYAWEMDSEQTITKTLTDGANLSTTTVIGTDGTTTITSPDGTITEYQEGPDPRFYMLAPIIEEFNITTPTVGLTYESTTERSTTLSDDEDWTTLQTQTDTITINGREYTETFTSSTSTLVTTSPESRTTTSTIDSQGRVTNYQISGLEGTSYGYDANGRLQTITIGTTLPRTYTLSYYSTGVENGWLYSITNPESQSTIYEYDNAGRVTTQTLTDGRQIIYSYDDDGNLTSITTPETPIHSFNYNALNLEDIYTPPDIGLTTNITTYAYNDDQKLDLITRPDGNTIDPEYDTAGRLATITTPRGTHTYNYNTTTGNLDSISAPGSESISYTYDGSLLTGQTWSGTISGSVQATYDDNFWVDTEGINSNSTYTIDFDYDDDGLLTAAGDLTLTPDPNHGLVTATTISNITSATAYSEIGEIETETFTNTYAGTTPFSMSITDRDDLGRIEQRTINLNGTTYTYDYTYDTAGRLYTANISGLTSNTYTYDNNGNRDGGTYDDQDRLTSYGTNSYTYTDNGELLTKYNSSSGITTTYNYDVLGNLITVTSSDSSLNIEYVIDGQNRRIGKKESGSLTKGWLYNGQLQLAAELDGSGNVTKRFIYAEKSNVPSYMVTYSSGTATGTYRFITDHLGSVMMVVDVSDGSIDQQIIYDEFGNILSDTSPGFQPFGFAGGLYDEDTGLVRFGARDYDPEVGRWTMKDPIRFDGGDINLYGYTFNDPVNFIDSNGKYVLWIADIAYKFWESILSSSELSVCDIVGNSAVETYLMGLGGSCAGAGFYLKNPGMIIGGTFIGLTGVTASTYCGEKDKEEVQKKIKSTLGKQTLEQVVEMCGEGVQEACDQIEKVEKLLE